MNPLSYGKESSKTQRLQVTQKRVVETSVFRFLVGVVTHIFNGFFHF
jgi:hypothetical protein